jgi:hypothetical protein
MITPTQAHIFTATHSNTINAHAFTPTLCTVRAANRLYNGKAAETELRVLADQGRGLQSNDLVRHNMVVFSGGQGALKVSQAHVSLCVSLSL